MGQGVANKFNRGEVDPEVLAREDIKRVNSSASYMKNFLPMRLGPMVYRPGFEYISSLTDAEHYLVPFITTIDNPVILDFTAGSVSFLVDNVAITSTAVTSTILNGDFATDISNWTDSSGGTGVAEWHEGSLSLTGDGSSNGSVYQTITTQAGVEHSLRLSVTCSNCIVKIGTTGAASYDLFTGTLKSGLHVLTFTPDSDITITIENALTYRALIDSIEFLGAGVIALDTETFELAGLRHRQSIDVMFMAAAGVKPFQIERRGGKSWSVVEYKSNDGPFGYINDSNVALTPGAIKGNTTLTSSIDYFTDHDYGRIYKLLSQGQTVYAEVAVNTGAGTDSIRVTGVGTTRIFTLVVTVQDNNETVTLQRSTDNVTWEDLEQYTVNTSKAFDDDFDNAILFYRLWIKAGDNVHQEDTTLQLVYAGGEIEGIGRVTEVVSSTVVNIQVVKDFGGLNATLNWYAGEWYNGYYPTAVDIYEGRVWYGRDDKIYGSVSDSYYSHDESIEGNSAAIKKTIGFGAVSSLRWLRSGLRLMLGTLLDEITMRSSSYGEVLTASNANIKAGTNQGSDNVDPVMIDNVVYFVQRSGVKLFSMLTFAERDDASTSDVNVLNRNITKSGIVRIAFTRQPETRLYCVLADGTMGVYTVDDSEEVAAWSRLSIDGLIKDVVVLPGLKEDQVYIVVYRNSVYSLQKMAMLSESTEKAKDSFVSYSSAGTTLSGLDHLEGEVVEVIGDKELVGSFTVDSGAITVPKNYASACVGLPYTASYVSNKLSGYRDASVLAERKRVISTGVVLMDYYHKALTIGPTDSHMKNIPRIKKGNPENDNKFVANYDQLPFPFDGNTQSDPRVHIKATAPCTILALTYELDELNQQQGR